MNKGYMSQFAHVHSVGASIKFSNFTTDGQQIKIGTIPAGSLVKVGNFNVSTAFSPTSLSLCQFQVGTVANPSLFLAATTVDTFSAAFTSVNTGRGLLASDTDVYIQLNKNAMAALPTAGAAQYYLEYFPPNQNQNLTSQFDT